MLTDPFAPLPCPVCGGDPWDAIERPTLAQYQTGDEIILAPCLTCGCDDDRQRPHTHDAWRYGAAVLGALCARREWFDAIGRVHPRVHIGWCDAPANRDADGGLWIGQHGHKVSQWARWVPPGTVVRLALALQRGTIPLDEAWWYWTAGLAQTVPRPFRKAVAPPLPKAELAEPLSPLPADLPHIPLPEPQS